ncbi:lymphocyte-specific protein 1 isoform X2 [Hyperolius riggenbachi]|uniref:lymphocyte-specific protein 1 isoform X2 n=1 Tax=Hyperolius riggenbachi TaxID=752182 RepID=UPI0035A322A9
MSTSILRRDSGKKSLQNLLRLTTQWSVEDEEEAARERRRRERQLQDPESEEQSPEDLNDENNTQTDNHVGLKPAGAWETEEDEGFSDWSQKLEQRKQQAAAMATEEREEASFPECDQTEQSRATDELYTNCTETKGEEEEDEHTYRSEAAEVNYESEVCTQETEATPTSDWQTREVYDEEYRAASPRVSEEPAEEHEEREEIREERYTFVEKEAEPEHVPRRWESDEVEGGRQSVNSDREDGEDLSAVKVTEMAEVLNRSIQKSNSIKRSEPLLPIHKIDDFLEQYTSAIETSTKPGPLVRTPSLELLAPADAVASIKNRWETGDVTAASKMSPCKDTDGINIGVSDMINQWGKGKSETDSQASPPQVTEVKPGDVLSKKTLWEKGNKSGDTSKNATPNKKYKFVPTGHGKYEKVLVDEP